MAIVWITVGFCHSATGQESEGAKPGETANDGNAGSTAAPTTDAPSQQADGIESAEHPESYLDFAFAGGYLMIPIGVLSLLWMTFFVERLVTTRRGRVFPGALGRAVAAVSSDRKLDSSGMESICTAHPSSAARVLKVAIDRLDEPLAEIEYGVNTVAQREIHWLRRYLGVFAVIAAVAPLIGLLGTVTGMIQAFREVAIQGLGSGQALAPGIYKALVTTAAGLVIAIPALITYHWLMSRVDNFVHAINNLVVDFVEAHRPKDASTTNEPRAEFEGVAASGVEDASQ